MPPHGAVGQRPGPASLGPPCPPGSLLLGLQQRAQGCASLAHGVLHPWLQAAVWHLPPTLTLTLPPPPIVTRPCDRLGLHQESRNPSSSQTLNTIACQGRQHAPRFWELCAGTGAVAVPSQALSPCGPCDHANTVGFKNPSITLEDVKGSKLSPYFPVFKYLSAS